MPWMESVAEYQVKGKSLRNELARCQRAAVFIHGGFIDLAGIQFKVLNRSKGPAVYVCNQSHGTRPLMDSSKRKLTENSKLGTSRAD